MTLNSALSLAYNQLTTFAGLDDFWGRFDTAFGTNYDRTMALTFKLQWLAGDFSLFPTIEVVSDEVLGTANGAYGSNNTIYVSEQFLSTASESSLVALLLEEYGHFVDAQVNSVDSAGDEGAVFAALVQGEDLSISTLQTLKVEDDHGTIMVNGEVIQVEKQNFTGTAGNDTINGTSGDDSISGLAGNDVLNGLDGNDTIDGGDGNDAIDGGNGINTINGGNGDDSIIPATGISVDDGSTVDGGAGTDTLTVDFTNANFDYLNANGLGIYNDSTGSIIGRYAGNRLLTISNVEIFKLTGTPYNDDFTVKAGDSFDVGAGLDRLNFDLSNATTTVNVDLSQATNQLTYSSTVVKNFETFGTLKTGSGNDTINLGNGNTVDDGGTVDGGAGTDTLIVDFTNANFDYINANGLGIYNDSTGNINGRYADNRLLTISNVEIFKLTGTPYNDDFTVKAGDSFDAGAGLDRLNFDLSNATTTVNVDLSQATNQLTYSSTVVKNFETFGTLKTGSGNDTINLGNGNTVDDGGTVDGGAGTDTLTVDFTNANFDYLNANGLGIYNDSTGSIIGRYAGNRLLTISNVEIFKLTGTAYNDDLQSFAGSDTILGGAGDDAISGGVNDSLDGGTGSDALSVDLSSITTAINLDLTQSNNYSSGNTVIKNFEAFGTLKTGTVNDVINLGSTNRVDDGGTVDGGAGTDTLTVDFTNANFDYLNANGFGIYNDSTGSIIGRYAGNRLLTISNVENFKLTGTPYNDDFTVKAGDSFDAGTGLDRLNLDLSNATTTVNVDLSQTTNQLTYSSTVVKNFETFGTLKTGSGNDTINLGNGNTVDDGGTVDGGAGNDTLIVDFTNANFDYLNANGLGIYNDSTGNIIGRYADNRLLTISNVEIFKLTGTPYNDDFTVKAGDSFDAGAGLDRLNFDLSNATTTVNVDLSQATNQLTYSSTVAKNFETFGTLKTGSGNDTINLGNGNTGDDGGTVDEGAGSDTLIVDFTNANFDGLNGNGLGLYNDSTGSIFGRYANNRLLTISNVEIFKLTGTAYNDSLQGFAGNDTLIGGAGNDEITGGAGNDIIDGVNGTAITPGQGEIDILKSGTGNDLFVLGNVTKDYYDDNNNLTNGSSDYADIADFNTGDVIQLQGSSTNYLLNVVGADTQILINKPSTEPDELIGIVRNQTALNLNSNSFVYASLSTITLAVSPASVTENGTNNLVYTFTRTSPTTNALTVNYTIGGTATNGTDYTSIGTSVTFAANASTATVIIDPTADNTIENNETTTLTLATGNYNIGTTAAVTGTITNDDFPVLSINNVTVVEGQDNNALLTISFNNPINQTVTVNYTTTAINATANVDYTSKTGSLTIVPNSYFATLSIPLLNDSLNEGDEAFLVTLSSPVNALLDPNASIGEVTITDTLQTTISRTLSANVENLKLNGTDPINGTGNAGNNVLTGNSANNILNGGAGNDTLNGGAGNDTLIGGLGNDVYQVDSTTDVITENVNEGTDTIQSSVTFSLATFPNIENLTLTGSSAINGTGNAANNVLTGNTANNTLNGGDGNDTLNGGTGVDTLIGGLGNDIYQVDSTTDVITENTNEGTDTIQSSVTFSLAAFPNIENLTLTGSSAINGTGNTTNNTLTGNTANNILDGGDGNDTLNGGAGNDTLIGGNGNDYAYYYSSTASVIVNLAIGTASDGLGGTDNLSQIEHIQGSNTAGDNLTGDVNNNIFYGYGGNDTLNGGDGNDTLVGGTGNDLLTGGNGNDTAYYYTVTGAVTVNLATGIANDGEGGTDTLSQIENIQGSNTAGDNLTGNTGVNVLYGYGGADILTGGLGNDLLYLGSDTVTDTVNYASGDGTDTVYNFVRGVGGDILKFASITAIDVQVSGTSTLFKVGDGISGNIGFGTGTLLLTTSATSGFVAADVNINLLGATFAFS